MGSAVKLPTILKASSVDSLPQWRITSTPPLSGQDNMRLDSELLKYVQAGILPPTLRFFQFDQPTVTFGRLQRLQNILPLIPPNWPTVQRPTGGGIVFHDGDVCFSLAWRASCPAVPPKLKDVYGWIHRIVQRGLSSEIELTSATCASCAQPSERFEIRQCFSTPVPFDLLQGTQKIVGGALARQKDGFLYQGIIRGLGADQVIAPLSQAFAQEFFRSRSC